MHIRMQILHAGSWYLVSKLASFSNVLKWITVVYISVLLCHRHLEFVALQCSASHTVVCCLCIFMVIKIWMVPYYLLFTMSSVIEKHWVAMMSMCSMHWSLRESTLGLGLPRQAVWIKHRAFVSRGGLKLCSSHTPTCEIWVRGLVLQDNNHCKMGMCLRDKQTWRVISK